MIPKKQTFEQVLLKVASILPEYRIDEILSSGNGRSTYRACYPKTSSTVIMKVYDISKQNNLSRVIKTLRSLANTEYFLNFYELTYDKQMTQLILIEEYAQRTLKSLIIKMSENDFTLILQQVCESVQICHQKGVLHNRIRSSCIFKRGKIYVLGEPDIQQVLTSNISFSQLPYQSLEQLEGKPSLKSDIYQIGILIYEFMNQAVPFRAKDQSGQIKLLQNELTSYDLLKLNHSFSKKLNILCLACLSILESHRPKIGKVIEYLNADELNPLKMVPLIFESTSNQYVGQIFELLTHETQKHSISEVTVVKTKDKTAEPFQLISQTFFRPGKTLKANYTDISQPRIVDALRAVDIKNLRDEFEIRPLLSKMPGVRGSQKDSLHAQRYFKRPKLVPAEDCQPDPEAYNTDRIMSTRYDTVDSGVQTSRPSFPRLTIQSQAKKQIFLHQILKNYVNRKEIA